MTRYLRQFLRFVSGIPFAVALISLTALFTILGTVLEAWTDSHAFASAFSYSSPAFLLLLAGFFINILLSALQRWPFQKHHTGFLLTHLGLLMLILGVFIKQLFGLQGHMLLKEGSGSQQVLLDHNRVVKLIPRNPKATALQWKVPVSPTQPLAPIHFASESPVTLTPLSYWDNSSETPELWVKGNEVQLAGFSPLPVTTDSAETPLQPVANADIQNEPWHIYCFSTNDLNASLRKLLVKDTHIIAYSPTEKKEIGRITLEEFLKKGWSLQDREMRGSLVLQTGESLFSQPPQLLINAQGHEHQTSIQVPLTGADALLNQSTPHGFPLTLILQRPAQLAFIQDSRKDQWLFSIDAHGYLRGEHFPYEKLDSYIAYNQGFAGYFVESNVLPPSVPRDHANREKLRIQDIERRIRIIAQENRTLIPPFQHLREACARVQMDFAHVLVRLLLELHSIEGPYWPTSRPLPNDLAIALSALNEGTEKAISPEESAARLAAGMRLFGIDWSTLQPQVEEEELGEQLAQLAGVAFTPGPVLETPLTRRYQKQPSLTKREDNTPLIALRVRDATSEQELPLRFDRTASDLPWPLLNEQYLARFQPQTRTIPYRLRLHRAWQTNHPGSSQARSYEATLTITDQRSKKEERATLRMNHVYETGDGYRFYLANISPSDSGSVKRIQLVVNRDPAKYWLTYPGGFFITLGIALLFITQPYRKRVK